jgi:type VI secretion system secreted protein Hcp
MAFDAFIQIDDIEGESADAGHAGWIEVLDYDLSVGQRASSTAGSAGGASVERSDFSDFGFSKRMDLATPQLALACASGTHIDTITIDLCRAGKDKVRFMQYKLSNCLVSAFCSTSDDGELPVDNVTINYGKVELCYTRQNRAGGGAAGNSAAGWDLQRNRRV